MNDPVILFLSFLAIACQVFILASLLVVLLSPVSNAVAAFGDRVVDQIRPLALWSGFIVALVTMFGSLYLSEVKHFTPCNLCWTQRALLYPQVVLFAFLVKNPGQVWLRRLAMLLLMIDIPVSTYHYLLERFPNLETSVCDISTPCTLVYVWQFHYLSVPLMALTAALTLLIFLVMTRPTRRMPSSNYA